jgi:GNAT superfamily N-acetyltransferase
MKLQIRPCRLPDDLLILTEMLHRAYAELAARGWRYTATYQTPDVTEQRIKKGHGFVAEIDGELAGTITVRRPQPKSRTATYREDTTFTFGQFGVDPAFRGRGVGRALHEHALRFAEANGATAMALDTAVPATHLIALYAKWGYREVERCQWEDTNYPSVIMRKELKPSPAP